MADDPMSRALTLTEQRDRTIQTLIDHFAEDRLTMEELEKRLDAAHRALKPTELARLTADLPAQTAPPPAPAPARPPATRPLQTPDTVRDHQVMAAIMGGVEKKGRWTPARKNLVLAFMGGAELDFREAILAPGDTEVQVFTIWGGVEIIVGPGTHVDCGGVAIMGAFEHMAGPTVDDPNAPTIRVTGLALMAGVEVHVRYPGESARDASQRRREERKRLREERKRLRGES